jgi:hypothetical protein
MENQLVRVLRVVVASPGDVEAERNALPDVIDEVNRGVAADRKLRLELSRWETNTYPSFNADGPQCGIDPILNIEQCDLLIGLFWHRFGTPTADADSGTEHEFRLAYGAWKRSGRPQIMVYFNEKAASAKSKEETDQWGRVLEFKHNFPKEGLWWPYKHTAEFVSLVRNHLTQYVRQFDQANTQRKPHGTPAIAEPSTYITPQPAIVPVALGTVKKLPSGGSRPSAPGPVAKPATPEPKAAPLSQPVVHDHSDMGEGRGVTLLSQTLLGDLPPDARETLAEKLVGEIRTMTGLAEERLFDAVRFFIEFHLLQNDNPTAVASLEESLTGGGHDTLAELRPRLRQRDGDFKATPIVIRARFFVRTNAHASLWKTYFDTVVSTGASTENTVTSLAPIHVGLGFLSPQFLVAGLLSRFEDDWRPVLNAYQRSIPDPRQRKVVFESLQASQWNCWLMWGPSIPVCQCREWQGGFALQYGYGDENNSIPALEISAGGTPRLLDPIVATLKAECRGAKFVSLTGHLRWGPFFLCRDDGQRLLVDYDEGTDCYGMAGAQASMYDQVLAHRQDSDSLVLQVGGVNEARPEPHVYYSAYLWMMFLVAVRAEQPGTRETDPTGTIDVSFAGPTPLNRRQYPAWNEDVRERRTQARIGQLWGHLLPVFVHANIGDADALSFQRGVLVENAIQLLRQVWQRRSELFDAKDVEAGIEFHLVGASDYSGCGCDVRFGVPGGLVDRVRVRLDAEPDRAFAESVVPPRAPRPWALAGYFSTCHLPEIIAAYYEHVAQLFKAPPRQ